MERKTSRTMRAKGPAVVTTGKKPAAAHAVPLRGKREQRKVQTRMEILQAASRVFGDLGYGETRVEDIIEAAGISRPTFYRFFASKDDLYDAVDELASMSLMQMVAGAVASSKTPVERLEKGAEAYLRWLASTGPVASVMRQESARVTSHLYARRRNTMAMLNALFDEEVYRAHGKRLDPLLFSSLMGAIESVGNELTAGGGRVGEAEIQRGKRVVRRVFRATLSLPGEPLPELPKR